MMENLSQMPTGGLASFLTSNMDEIDDNVLAFGKAGGINSMSKIANRMANMGRNGDNELVHVKTGELIVSPEVLEKNPKLAQELAQEFQNSNENMGDYVVGSESNSINPMTGQREFFLKGLVKGIKGIFSKVAGFILPGLIGMIPGIGPLFKGLSPVLQSAIAGGIGGLAGGKGIRGALEGAAIGGLGTGLMKGLSSSYAGEGFGKGFAGALGKGAPVIEDMFEKGGGLFPKGFIPKGGTDTEIFSKAKSLMDEATKSGFTLGPTEARKMATDALSPSFKDYIPTALAGTAALGALGGFDTPEQTMPDPYGVTSRELVDKDSGRYRVLPKYIAPQRTALADVQAPTPDPYLFAKMLEEQPRPAAQGGEMFPRKTGAINGPGTEKSDDVPAMLSDGEFVMTSRAVRGLGNGSREQGVKKMYDMMKNFERSVSA
tara:strand:+ start:3962 stop:5257 length:1296 start_codon:yes stop_codon:yes gene_type:complete